MTKSDGNAVYISSNTGTYATGAAFPGTGTTGVTASTPNAPFTTAQFSGGNPIQARLVGCCVYLWYLGSELNLQGEYVGLSDPDNQDVGSRSGAVVLADPTSIRVPITSQRKTLVLSWLPTNPNDLDFNDQTANDSASIGCYFNGTTSTSGVVGFEVHALVEYIGGSAPYRTYSSSDPNGFAAVMMAAEAQGASVYESATKAARQMVTGAAQALIDLSGPAANMLTKYASGKAMSYLAGALLPGAGGALVGAAYGQGQITVDIDGDMPSAEPSDKHDEGRRRNAQDASLSTERTPVAYDLRYTKGGRQYNVRYETSDPAAAQAEADRLGGEIIAVSTPING